MNENRPRCSVEGCPGRVVTANRPVSTRPLCSWHDGSVLTCVCRAPDFDGLECRRCWRGPRTDSVDGDDILGWCELCDERPATHRVGVAWWQGDDIFRVCDGCDPTMNPQARRAR